MSAIQEDKVFQLVVGVVIVGKNEKMWLQAAFKSILSSDFKGRIELFYVDNNSQDGSAKWTEAHFPQIHVISSNRNLGFSSANNKGIQKALQKGADYVFLVNPDTITPKGLISSLVGFMEKHLDFGAIGPLQSVYGHDPEERNPPLNEWSKQALINRDRHVFYLDFPRHKLIEIPSFFSKKIDHTLEHAYVQGAALFIRTKLLYLSGLFDTAYHTFYEEVDLCRRIRWMGYRVALLTNVFIQHKGDSSTKDNLHKLKHMMRNKYYYLLTDPTWNFEQMKKLFFRWLKHDWKMIFPAYLKLGITNAGWLLFNIPKILLKRRQYKKISKDKTLKIIPE